MIDQLEFIIEQNHEQANLICWHKLKEGMKNFLCRNYLNLVSDLMNVRYLVVVLDNPDKTV